LVSRPNSNLSFVPFWLLDSSLKSSKRVPFQKEGEQGRGAMGKRKKRRYMNTQQEKRIRIKGRKGEKKRTRTRWVRWMKGAKRRQRSTMTDSHASARSSAKGTAARPSQRFFCFVFFFFVSLSFSFFFLFLDCL